jgi:hypothetical protein
LQGRPEGAVNVAAPGGEGDEGHTGPVHFSGRSTLAQISSCEDVEGAAATPADYSAANPRRVHRQDVKTVRAASAKGGRDGGADSSAASVSAGADGAPPPGMSSLPAADGEALRATASFFDKGIY